MSDDIFPDLPGIKWEATLTPIWKSVIQESVSGREIRASLMTYPRYRISLAYEFLRAGGGADELATLVGFFNAHRGAGLDFLWLDPDDNVVTDEPFGTGDGAALSFQLSRDRGGFREPVRALKGSVVIKSAGSVVTQPASVAVSSAGAVTFTAPPAPAAGLTWSGEFYKRVRFMRDEMDFDRFLQDLWSAKKVELITVKR